VVQSEACDWDQLVQSEACDWVQLVQSIFKSPNLAKKKGIEILGKYGKKLQIFWCVWDVVLPAVLQNMGCSVASGTSNHGM
jgi:hypothetical protein